MDIQERLSDAVIKKLNAERAATAAATTKHRAAADATAARQIVQVIPPLELVAAYAPEGSRGVGGGGGSGSWLDSR